MRWKWIIIRDLLSRYLDQNFAKSSAEPITQTKLAKFGPSD